MLFVLCSGFRVAYSQNKAPLVKQWDARFGGSNTEYLEALYQTPDEGFLITSFTNSDSGGDITESLRGGVFDVWVVKTDSLGRKQWDKRFGGENQDHLVAVHATKDGGYIFGGRTNSDSSLYISERTKGSTDFWMVKTDSAGNKQWDKRFGNDRSDNLYDLQLTRDGGYILGGFTTSNAGGDVSEANRDTGAIQNGDAWILKTDSTGKKLWDRRYGGPNLDYVMSLEQTRDGGYILAGYTNSDSCADISQPSRGRTDYWLIKTDSEGYKLWDKRYGGSDYEMLRSVQQTKDGGYVLGGFSYSPISGDKTEGIRGASPDCDYWTVKTDSLGIKQWDKRFGGINAEDEFGYVRQTRDGGFLIGGTSYSNITGDKTENNLGNEQSWIVKIDASGSFLWDKTIFTKAGTSDDEAGYAIQCRDGGVIVANYTRADSGGFKTQMSRGLEDLWMVKFADTSWHCNLSSPNITADRDTLCSGDTSLVCAPSGFNSYQWNVGESGKCIEAKQAGNYYVTVSDANNCTAESNHISIIVHPVPSVSIVLSADTFSSSGGVSYLWYKDDFPISTATSSFYIAKEPGFYLVEVTDSNGCVAFSNPISFTGINDVAEDRVEIYPNPSSMNNVQLTISNGLLGSKLEVYDYNGRLVFQSAIRNPKSEILLDVAPGIYMLLLVKGDKVATKKLLKE